MKFLCDRCKTRYSIADERVRGKILKIRCKNCSAVITVREGMSSPEEVATPAPAAAAAATPTRPPPSLHDEWYVSQDGNQEGPFLLPEAQAWVAARSPDDELHCWCEGFDDWLPVEKVSHFRGLRGKVTRARTPTRPGLDAQAARSEPARPVAPPPRPEPEPEPRPLFAATMAALEAEAARDAAAPAPEPARAPAPLAARPPTAATPATGSPRVGTPATGSPRVGTPAAGSPRVATPATGSPRVATPASGSPRVATPASGSPRVAAVATPPPRPLAPVTPASAAVATPPPRPALSPLRATGATATVGAAATATASASPSAAGVATAAAPTAVVTPVAAPTPAAPAPAPLGRATPRPAPMFDTGDAGDDAAAAGDDAAAARGDAAGLADDAAVGAHDPVDDLDDDLSIGEVSRVVRLADIASGRAAPAARPAPAVRNPTAASAAIARGTGAVARVDGPALADAAPVAGGDAPSIYQSVTAPPPRRRTFLYLGAAVVVLAVIAVVVIVATSGAGSSADEAQVGATRHYDDLGGVHRPLDRGAGRDPQVEAADAGVGAGTGSARRPGGGSAQVRPGGGSASGSGPGSGSASGKVETPVLGPDGQPLRPLTADDVFAMSSKMEIGTRRCYERALKDDPFLKVSKIRATITVKPGGEVSSVQLSSMQGTPLATCLTAAIGRWRFRASTEGIVSEFALVFEQR